MVSFAVGLGSFANGFTQGTQIARQVKGALDERHMRKVQKEGNEAATAARESDITNAIQTTTDPTGAQTFTVGDKTFDTPDKARNAAASQVGTVMDYYRQNTVPKLIEGYAKTGDMGKAQQLQSWMDTQDANGITKDWARATRMAMLGDNKAAMKGFGKLYERLDPGAKFVGSEDITEPVYEDIKDASGKVTGQKQIGTKPIGVRLKLKSSDGEDVSHDFGGQEDLFRAAMFTLSPDKFADRAIASADAASTARATAASERAKEGRKMAGEVALKKVDAVITDQRDQRQHERSIMRDDRNYSQQTRRDEIQHGYRLDESATDIQMRAAFKIADDTGEKPEDVRKSLETVTKRLSETDLNFSKLSPEEQNKKAVEIYTGQRSSARGILGAGSSEAKGIPKLW